MTLLITVILAGFFYYSGTFLNQFTDLQRAIIQAVILVIAGVLGLFLFQKKGRLNTLLTEVFIIADKARSFTEKFTTQIEQLGEEFTELSGTSEEVAASSQEMTATTEEISENMTSIAASSETVQNKMKVMLAEVEEMEGKIEKSRTDFTSFFQFVEKSSEYFIDVGHDIENFSSSIKDIEDIIGGVEDIAGQTRLLALNAAIEAARAGEYGRGFSVVADEIGELAEESQKLVQQVREMTGKINGNLTGLINRIELLGEEVEENSNLLDITRDYFASIEGTTKNVSRLFRANSKDLLEQMEAVSQINEQVDDIAGMVNEISSSIENTSANILNKGQIISNLAQDGSDLLDNINRLYTTVNSVQGITELNPRQEKKVGRVADELGKLAEREAFKRLDEDEITTILQQQLDRFAVDLLCVVDIQGRPVTSHFISRLKELRKIDIAEEIGNDMSYRQWFRQVVRTGERNITQPYLSMVTEETCVTVSVPIKRDELVGVLVADIRV
ncbi:MAG: methyl-accepting chemotaxis protein [Halanaerobium sp.]|nr:methyl-accepting chemotaxis protein [Halanaerobium sp.]